LAAAELLADKLPAIPARTAAAPLAGRALTGAWTASAIAAEAGRGPRARVVAAVMGAATAIGAAFAGYHLRRWVRRETRLPDAAVAVAEDALALALPLRPVPRAHEARRRHSAARIAQSPYRRGLALGERRVPTAVMGRDHPYGVRTRPIYIFGER
jgi:hypothetical protein